jgi:hypothetical protein
VFDPADTRTTDVRRWRRHGRRCLKIFAVVVLAACGVGGAAWLYLYLGWRAEQPVIAAARADGVSFDWTFTGPAWPPYRGRTDIRRRVYRADMYGTAIPKHLPAIAPLGHLRSLTLRSPSDSSLAGIRRARGLRELMILYVSYGGGPTEAGLDTSAACRSSKRSRCTSCRSRACAETCSTRSRPSVGSACTARA